VRINSTALQRDRGVTVSYSALVSHFFAFILSETRKNIALETEEGRRVLCEKRSVQVMNPLL
jgi:hypothetical protein